MMSFENNEIVQPANGGEIRKQTVNPDSTPNDLYNPDKGSLMADKEYNTQNEMDRIVKDMAPKPSNGGELDASSGDFWESPWGQQNPYEKMNNIPAGEAGMHDENRYDRSDPTSSARHFSDTKE